MIADAPQTIAARIERLLGPDPEASSPGGMSGASVLTLTGRHGSVILKRSASPREWHVYTVLEPLLRASGVDLPRLLGAEVEDGFHWLLLEHIGQPLPRERWLADPDVVAMLRRLHEMPISRVELHPERYAPGWPRNLTSLALSLFDPDAGAALAGLLEEIRQASQPLFEPRCLLSADPSPPNWGLRENGDLVLFDWERISLGEPAIDLAITVPGLAVQDDFRKVAALYLSTEDAAEVDRLATNMVNAKIWTIVELLASHVSGRARLTFPVENLVSAIPEWLDSLG